MRYYVIINGVNSLTIEGLAIKTLPPISKPAMRNIREEIDGRDGDITTELGYGAYDRILEIGLYGAYDIDKIISFFNSKGTIIFSDEPDKYYNFEIVDRIDYTKLVKFRTAMINIHCQPFKYPVTEEPQVEEFEYVEGTGEAITLNNTAEAILNKIELNGNTSQQTYTGKNKIDGANPTDYNIATSSFTNDIIKVSSTTTSTTPYARWVIEGINANDIIRYSGIIMNSNGQIVIQYDNNGTWTTINGSVKQYTDGTTPATYSWTNNLNTTKVRLLLYANKAIPTGASESSYKNVILTINNSDLSYEPYVGGIPAPNPDYPEPIHVVTGDNTIEICGENILDDSILEQGYYPNSANPTIAGTTDARYRSFTMYLKAGTYTINFDKSPQITRAFTSYNYSTYNTLGVADTNKVNTFTITQDGAVYFSFRKYDGTNWNATNDKVWLTNKNTGTNYQAYTGETYPINLGEIELCKMGNYQDYIKHEGGKWYIHKEIAKKVFDGSEGASAWVINNGNTPNFFYRYRYIDDRADEETMNNLCNRFKRDNIASATTMVGFMVLSNGEFRCRTKTQLSKDDFIEWITNNPLEVYYIAANITDTEITNEALIEQLEALSLATSKNPQTNILQVNGDQPFILDVSALKLGSDHLVINNAGNIYAKPTMDIEGTGVVDIYLNDVQILEADLTETNNIVIDTESMEAYNPDTNALANRQVTGDYSKIKLEPGENDLRFSGDLSKATITNYKRWL